MKSILVTTQTQVHNKPDINFFEERSKLNTDHTWLICPSGHVHKDGFNRFTERNKFTIKVWGSIWNPKSLAKQVTRLKRASASSLWPDNRFNIPSLEGATLCVGRSRFPGAYPWIQRALCLLHLFMWQGPLAELVAGFVATKARICLGLQVLSGLKSTALD